MCILEGIFTTVIIKQNNGSEKNYANTTAYNKSLYTYFSFIL